MKKASLVFILILAMGLGVSVGLKVYLTKDKDSKNNIEEIVVESKKQSAQNDQKSDKSSIAETILVEETYRAEANKQNATIEGSSATEILSDEDKAVKAEIAKHRETDIDFRYNKQETIKGKTFDVAFAEIEYATDYKRVLYKNSFGDEFAYDTDNGKLRYAVMESAVVPKTTESINQEKAQAIAVEYVSSNCNIDKYTMDQCKEIDSGYYFCFTRYIGSYPSSDRYGIQIGYNGDVVYLSDNTYVFSNKNIDFDKNFIDAKIKEHSDESKVDWDSIKICLNDGKVAISYTIPEQHAVAVIPLE